jgi:hypothetical protein
MQEMTGQEFLHKGYFMVMLQAVQKKGATRLSSSPMTDRSRLGGRIAAYGFSS